MLRKNGITKEYRVALAVLIAVLILPVASFAQSTILDVEEVLRMVLEQNAAVQIADALSNQAEAIHRQTLADTKPQIDLQMDPAYGYSTGNLAGVPYLIPPAPDWKTDVSLGLSLSQALPTAGIASLSLANTTSVTMSPGNIFQIPSATFVLTQPVWVNGKLIDLRLLSATRRVSEINWRTAADGSREARNGNIFATFSLYVQVIGLRRNISYLERANNPTVRQDRLSLEKAQAEAILSGRADAPNLDLALTLLPQYNVGPQNLPTEFGDSFSSFFTDGTDLDLSLSIGLEIPLYNGKKATYREQVNTAAERIARETLEASLRNVRNTYEALILRQRIVQDRIELLEKNIELKARMTADEQRKLEVGLGTALRVESARLELIQVQNELWQARADLFLNSLDLLALSGRALEEVFGD